MLNFYAITVQTESGDIEVYVSPLLLQSKKAPNLKPGKLEKLYFYSELMDENYYKGLEQTAVNDHAMQSKYIINYGQDFEGYYIGCFNIDYDTRCYWQWEGKADLFTAQSVKTLAECLFNPNSKSRQAILFTPTPPFDINFIKIPY